VERCVVVARADAGGSQRLVAYYVPAEDADGSVARLRTELGAVLPEYMVPSGFVKLDQLPLTPNGKVDRKSLPEASLDREQSGSSTPRGDFEARLLDIWQIVLGRTEICLGDNFFELGGHSLQAVRLSALCERQLGFRPPLHAIFEAPTLEQYAAFIRPRFNSAKPLAELGVGNKNTGLVCFHAAGGTVFSYWNLAKHAGSLRAVYVPDEVCSLQDIKNLARDYDRLLYVDNTPPKAFLGWSFGGLVAYECACIAARRGLMVPVILLDSHLPSEEMSYKDGSDAEMLFDAIGFNVTNAAGLTIEEALRAAHLAGSLPLDFSISDAKQLGARLRFANRGIASYKPEPFEGDVYYFSSTETSPKAIAAWQECVKGRFNHISTKATHHTIIEDPFIGSIAEIILGVIINDKKV
jgi:thioesterase domain-containing protein